MSDITLHPCISHSTLQHPILRTIRLRPPNRRIQEHGGICHIADHPAHISMIAGSLNPTNHITRWEDTHNRWVRWILHIPRLGRDHTFRRRLSCPCHLRLLVRSGIKHCRRAIHPRRHLWSTNLQLNLPRAKTIPAALPSRRNPMLLELPSASHIIPIRLPTGQNGLCGPAMCLQTLCMMNFGDSSNNLYRRVPLDQHHQHQDRQAPSRIHLFTTVFHPSSSSPAPTVPLSISKQKLIY